MNLSFKMMNVNQYMKELEQKPFDPDTFAERLAQKVQNNVKGTDNYIVMKDTFDQSVKDLLSLLQRQKKKCDQIKELCTEEEKLMWLELRKLQQNNKECMNAFFKLDEKINSVAAKVMHLGGQLDNVHIPRSRAVEAQKLMVYFSQFLIPGNVKIEVFSDPNRQFEAADIVRKLYFIAQELPGERFDEAKRKIEQKYDDIEKNLIEQFVHAYEHEDTVMMKKLASILIHFKGYSQCVNVFIEMSQKGAMTGKDDIFKEVIPICEKNFKKIADIFSNPEKINAKFVLNIYLLKLRAYIDAILADSKDIDKYLKNLSDLYKKLQCLSVELSNYDLGTDSSYLQKTTQNIFQKYLDSYISTELKYIKNKFQKDLQEFYESKGHQKRQIHLNSLQEIIARDLQSVFKKTNLNFTQNEDCGGEMLLSENVTLSILNEAKEAFKRCQSLSTAKDLASNTMQIFEILLQYLITEYVDYAIDLGIHSIPIPESSAPLADIYFFEIVQTTNMIIHLLEKVITEHLYPLLRSNPKLGDCLSRKKSVLEQSEMKIDLGLDRSISSIISWVKIYLTSEQKKNDFKPDTDVDLISTLPCKTVVNFMKTSIQMIRECLGKNANNVLMELGIRFHRVIYEHLLGFLYNSTGAVCAICDINEYKNCAREINSNLVNNLFDTLHAMGNLLLVKPENLQQVCYDDENLSNMELPVLHNFIQLRSDYKSQKLSSSLKGLISSTT